MSPPPYELRDKATGQVVPGFEDMDAEPGKHIEVYKGDAPGNPNARISGGSVVRPGGEPPVDPPIDPPVDPPKPDPNPGEFMDKIDNEKQLADALNTYAAERRVGQCWSKVPIDLTKTITVRQTNNDGTPWGACGNYMKLNWKGGGGQDMIVYRGHKGVSNRGLFFEKFSMYGNGYDHEPAGACLKLYAPEGDPGCLYKFTVRDIFKMYATNGVALIGAVFEGLLDNVHAENHRSDGIVMAHTFTPGEHQGIVSNIMFMHPNSSRNMGAGMKQTYSCNSIFGSYVLNANGGILGEEGARVVAFSNGENTGEELVRLLSNGYGSVVIGCEGSTDGSTHARAFEGGQWVSKGKPMKFGVSNVGAYQVANHMATYGGATGQNYPFVKP